MNRKKAYNPRRQSRRFRIRKKISGTEARPRLSVFRSGKHTYAQIIDDTKGCTLVAASTLEPDIKSTLEQTNNVDAAAKVGEILAKKAKEKNITEVVFDRSGYKYHGKVKALAEASRENGLIF